MQKLSVSNSREAMSIIAIVDLVVIVPSLILFLVFNFQAINNFGLVFLSVILAFLFYLPLAILSASYYLSRKKAESTTSAGKEKVLPVILFLMLIFSMLGIYIPSIMKLALIIPSFGSLNIVGFTIVVINLTFIMKNIASITEE